MIEIVSGSPGSGNGVVEYSVTANPGSSVRNGTMTIAGQTFQVNQAGSNPITYTITASAQPENNSYPNPIPMPVSPYLKICGDGSRATWITVTVTGGTVDLNQLKLRIADSNGDIGYYGAFNNLHILGGNYVRTRFSHPRYMDEPGYGRSDEIQVYLENDPTTTLASLPIRVYRSPIAFIHGLGGNQSAFEVLADRLLITGQYPYDASLPWESPLFWRANYSSTSTRRFLVNRKVVPNSINLALSQAMSQGYSCGKVSVIGHSMGGVLSRIYLQSHDGVTYRQDMNRLITVSTPHFGTQLANHCAITNFPYPSACPVVLSIVGLGSPWGGLSTGAVSDLRVNSLPIWKLNNLPQLNSVPSVTLSSNAVGEVASGAIAFSIAFAAALSTGGANIYDSEANDLVVPMSSQRSNLNLQPVVSAQWHIGSAENITIYDQTSALLNSDPTGPQFAQAGFPQANLVYMPPMGETDPQVAARSGGSDQVSIDSPWDGQEFAAGASVMVDISYAGNMSRMLLMALPNGLDPIVIDTVPVNQLEFTIPANAVGNVGLFLLGGTDTEWTSNDEGYITVSASVPPDSIRAIPHSVTIPLGLTESIMLEGYFNGSSQAVSLVDANGLDIAINGPLLSYEGEGVFQALAVGSTEVVYTYLGLSDTTFVTIIDDPAALVAAFEYTDEVICEGESVTFTDASQGLAVSHEWTFPGGSPSSSTGPGAIVYYSQAGVYPVSLVTTFINGIDSISVDQLVVVNPNPEAVIQNGGNVLVASTENATYQWLDCANANTPIDGATDQEFYPTLTGQYAVAVTQNGCNSISDCEFFIITGVTTPGQPAGCYLAPNPNSGQAMLYLPTDWKSGTARIEDMAGRVLFSEAINGRQRVPLQVQAASGVYTLLVNSESGVQSLRFVVER
ncbi:MAG: PKD domain-containing protein [Flavobacteriales bacterium]|nr:PKD domain-containing protein [Flavobacteriales bacterium]